MFLSFYICATVWHLLFVIDNFFYVLVEVFAGVDIVKVLNYFVGFYVELGHVQRELLLLTYHTLPHRFLQVILQ